jgi:hypothetical protein
LAQFAFLSPEGRALNSPLIEYAESGSSTDPLVE